MLLHKHAVAYFESELDEFDRMDAGDLFIARERLRKVCQEINEHSRNCMDHLMKEDNLIKDIEKKVTESKLNELEKFIADIKDFDRLFLKIFTLVERTSAYIIKAIDSQKEVDMESNYIKKFTEVVKPLLGTLSVDLEEVRAKSEWLGSNLIKNLQKITEEISCMEMVMTEEDHFKENMLSWIK